MPSFLKDLIVSVKASEPREFSFLREADRFLIAENKIGREDPHWGDRDDIWHPSSLSYREPCPRLEIFGRLRPDLLPDGELHSPKTQRIFKLGSAVHAMYQNDIWGRMGLLWGCWVDVTTVGLPESEWTMHWGFMPNDDWIIPGALRRWINVELACFNERYNIGGHVDGVLCVDGDLNRGFITDLKTANHQSFSSATQVRDYHRRQVQFYMHCDLIVPEGVTPPTIEGGCVWYLDKDNCDEREFFFQKDTESIAKLLRLVDRTNASLAAQKLPSRLSACKTARMSKAKACDACNLCFTVGTGASGWKELIRMEAADDE